MGRRFLGHQIAILNFKVLGRNLHGSLRSRINPGFWKRGLGILRLPNEVLGKLDLFYLGRRDGFGLSGDRGQKKGFVSRIIGLDQEQFLEFFPGFGYDLHAPSGIFIGVQQVDPDLLVLGSHLWGTK